MTLIVFEIGFYLWMMRDMTLQLFEMNTHLSSVNLKSSLLDLMHAVSVNNKNDLQLKG